MASIGRERKLGELKRIMYRRQQGDHQQALGMLREHLGEDTPLSAITPAHADDLPPKT